MDMGRRQSTIELVAIDMDGTLLDPSHQLTPRARKAIAQARALGVHIVLTSGRPVPGLAPYLHELGITGNDDYCIACNGGLVQRVGTRETVVEYPLSFDDFLFCEQVAREVGVHFQALDSQRMYTPNQDISYYTVADSHLSRMPLSYRRVEDMDPSMSFIKLMMIDEPEVLDAAIARLPSELTERFAVLKSAPFFLEVFDHRAGKGPSLQKLAEHLGIDRANVMAIGDQENDLTMLQYAGTSVAMGNAIDAVKAVARFETSSNADEGVARAIERFVLQ
ncbi:sugar-phosphatase [Stenotrophomonas maltophilia]|uniref:sugar-phosphatase n=1 Tax=Stenotrophomonas TaxID=40323 RepID=UPI000C257CC7|nr:MULTISPECIES: sugar-phosphatase [unclassified Stenotrophomonas]MCU1057792.1 sugar-phosphatase [Stenotrophomonas maltophilia]MDH1244057.1 sugar-phosphatase [Stenotrophomonas sp. GD03948]MDH1580016.1 sugar-phosphatase [Stenotrophomonas sp. GD03744]PJL75184.1 sugar-phosphatase [Stenotrophomonas maltophilia]PZT39621.1 sugar-phosphatase [Stenotrophomonas maltophilia]